MKTDKKTRRSLGIRWSVFFAVLLPSILIVVLLWVLQTAFFGVFYRSVKEDELKKSAGDVVNHIESDDIYNRILFLSSSGDINIRVIETRQFETLYSSGESFDSVSFGLGGVGLYRLYEDTYQNGGELVRYYSDSAAAQNSSDKAKPDPWNNSDRFEPVPNLGFFDTIGKDNDLLYCKITSLADGTEIMVVADTRISPLDATVKTLKLQLIFATVIIIILALFISFILSRRIAKPIEKINKTAHSLASGKLNVRFEGKGYREIEQLNDTLNYASSELEKVDTLRRELMANVSHDMRTPLTMIAGYGEVMRDLPGENTPENAQVIINEANRLSGFVNSVLDLSKLQSGMESLNLAEVEISSLLQRTYERYRSLLPQDEVEFILQKMPPVTVICDENKISRALHNLIDNAVNYSRAPKRVVLTQKNFDDLVRIEISDNGDGIDRQELPYIWDRYYRTDKSHKRNVIGSGLGLSIVKEIFTMHGVKFGVETEKGVGSTFWFTLPVKKEKA